mgnify:CR=1 FL=1
MLKTFAETPRRKNIKAGIEQWQIRKAKASTPARRSGRIIRVWATPRRTITKRSNSIRPKTDLLSKRVGNKVRRWRGQNPINIPRLRRRSRAGRKRKNLPIRRKSLSKSNSKAIKRAKNYFLISAIVSTKALITWKGNKRILQTIPRLLKQR